MLQSCRFIKKSSPVRTNKQNIKARRADIATEKSIEAYREFVEKAIDIPLVEFAAMEDAIFEWTTVYQKNRLYFPKSISNDFYDVLSEWTNLIENKKNDKLTEDEVQQIYRNCTTKLGGVIDNIQKHIGLETEEKPRE